jgi:DNA polymerase-4
MDDLPTRIWPLPARRINGIGPKAAAKLSGLGIATIGELAACDRAWLMERFGLHYGAWLYDAAHGVDERPVVTESEPVSMSRETTFERDLHAVRDKPLLSGIFTQLCEQVAADLQRKGYVGRTVGIKLRFDDFKTMTRDLSLEVPTADAAAIRHAAGLCLKRADLSRRLRLLGVRVATLSRADAPPMPSRRSAKSPGPGKAPVKTVPVKAAWADVPGATELRATEPGLFDSPPMPSADQP